MEFYCQEHLVEHLQKQAKEMEDELKRWNDEVSVARKEFYELNYYTTHQLLILRRELGKLKNSGQTTQQAQVMALLESISMQITPTIVGNVVHQITTQVSEEREESNRPRSPISQGNHAPNSEIKFLASPHPSDHHDVVRPAVKSSVSLCQVSLSREKLSAQQEEHFTNIIGNFRYNEITALKAIEVVGDGDWNDIENWLRKNANRFEQELLQDDQGKEEEEQMSDSEDEEKQMSDHDSEEEIVLETDNEGRVYRSDTLSEFSLLEILNSVSSLQIFLPSPL